MPEPPTDGTEIDPPPKLCPPAFTLGRLTEPLPAAVGTLTVPLPPEKPSFEKL